jgi:chromate transporter
MLGFALYLPMMSGTAGAAVLSGLKLVAVAVVAHAVIGMSKQLCPDWPRRIIAILSTGIALAWSVSWMQLLVVIFGAAAGLCFCQQAIPLNKTHLPLRYSMRLGIGLLIMFAILLLGLPLMASQGNPLIAAVAAFYRAGALVFGGGHVVLPLLQQSVVDTGWISAGDFMAGYGAAQAMPGPMFSLAAYLGASLPGNSGGVVGAALALMMIFLPGLLLICATLPLWHSISHQPLATRAIAGINAAVVGLLAAALYNPVWTSGINNAADVVVALIGLLLLSVWRVSALWVVLWCVGASLVLAGL